MKKGLIFDLDGVIADTADYHYIAWKELAASLGIEINRTFNEQLKGISRTDSLEKILAFGNKSNEFSATEKDALSQKKNEHYVELLANVSPKDVLPGVEAFLKAAQTAQIPCAIASASKNAPFILKRLELFDYFQAIVDPETLANGKPDPEIFIRAAELLNISPEEAIGFEDAQAGIIGIKKAGMFAVGIVTGEELKGADLIARSFEELHLETLLAQANK